MQKADWITFIVSLLIVVCLALFVNLSHSPAATTPSTDPNSVNADTFEWDKCTDGTCCEPKIHYQYAFTPFTDSVKINLNTDYNSIYSAGAKGYPRLSFDGTISSSTGYTPTDSTRYFERNTGFMSSDIFQEKIWKNVTEFAYLEEDSSGFNEISGFSEIFGVPYNMWRIKVTIEPKGNLAYVTFKWLLIDSTTGDIVTGGEVKPDNPLYKKIEIADHRYYLMISASNVQSYYFAFETPEVSYNQAHIRPEISDLLFYLNSMQN